MNSFSNKLRIVKDRILIVELVPCHVVLALILVCLTGCGDSPELRKQKFLTRGNVSMREGNQDQALYYFNQSLVIDSCFADALNNIGTVHFNDHRYSEALTYYSRAIGCNNTFVASYFNRANTFIKTGDYPSAIADLDFILLNKPD